MDSVWYISQMDLTIRILIAALLGGLIGLERELSNHPAGFRTHILVCLGSTAIMLLSIYGFTEFAYEYNVRMDPARLAAQVISGIGFLGAGAILRTGSSVSGLTTAASIWVVAAIGLCVGAGFYYPAGLTTVIVLLCLFVLNKLEKLFRRGKRHQEVMIKIIDGPGVLGKIATLFGNHGIQIENVKMDHSDPVELGGEALNAMELQITLQPAQADKMIAALDDIRHISEVVSLESNKWSKWHAAQVNSVQQANNGQSKNTSF